MAKVLDMLLNQVVGWLSSVYASVDDIDLYVALVSELPPKPATGTSGVIGPTAACLIADNFAWLRYSDYYYYERSYIPTGFSSGNFNSYHSYNFYQLTDIIASVT